MLRHPLSSRLQCQDRRQNQLLPACQLGHQHHPCLRPQHHKQRETVLLSWPMLLRQRSLHQHSSGICTHSSMDRRQSQRQHPHIGLHPLCTATSPQPQLRRSLSSLEPPGAASSSPRPGQGAASSSPRPGQGAALNSPRPGQEAVLSSPRPGQGAALSSLRLGPGAVLSRPTVLSRVSQDVETASRRLTTWREPVLRPQAEAALINFKPEAIMTNCIQDTVGQHLAPFLNIQARTVLCRLHIRCGI